MITAKHNSRRQTALIVTALLTGLAGCGGGQGTSEASAAASGAGRDAATAAARSNQILTARDARVAAGSRATEVKAYLGWSAQVTRVTGHPASASFELNPPLDGYYELFLWWPQVLGDAGTVQAKIVTGFGDSTQSVDQHANGGQWVSLGFHRLRAGHSDRVLLTSEGQAPLYVDAFRAQFVGEQPPALQWRAPELAVGDVGTDYLAALTAAGGTAPYRFSLIGGTLPPGLSLDESTGVIRGIPQAAGQFLLEFSVRDAAGATLAIEVELVIEEASRSRFTEQPLGRERPSQREFKLGSSSELSDLSNLLSVVAAMPDGAWARVNLNSFSNVWAPAALRPLFGSGNPTPSKIIAAWSSFTWDSNRGKLLLYGGGHANYRGNDVYSWNGTTRLWERASLPSEMVQDVLGNRVAVDGTGKAPPSAHTYDNTMFFPLLDRMVVLGGAADPNGGHFMVAETASTSRKTGPYLFDPARADGNKVGGGTGSHVQRVAPYPEVLGGDMWSNREAWLNANAASAPPTEAFVNGCTGVTEENGQDVAYIRTAYRVYRYRIHDLSQPASDTWERVGRYWNGSGEKATCTYDHHRRALVTASRNSKPFLYWSMASAGSTNNEVYVTPSDPTGEFPALLSSNAIDVRNCALDYDPKRQRHLMWCGDERVWHLTPPATLSANGWFIEKAPAPPDGGPASGVGTGILGKWKYIPNLDVFMGLVDSVNGDIWVYKPQGWVNPTGGNLPPSVSLSAPSSGSTVVLGASVNLAASASDVDGNVVRVVFRIEGNAVGEITSPPYQLSWTPAAAGSYVVTALAYDDAGAATTSVPATLTVEPVPQPNTPPDVALIHPLPGASVIQGSPIRVDASASDSDGAVVRVDFYANGVLIGADTQAPYTINWVGATAGTHTLMARAIDDDGDWADSPVVNTVVAPSGTGGSTTAVIQRGLAGSVVADAYLSSFHPTSAFGSASSALDRGISYSPLLRIAVFQSEGGPVPNGAIIESAVLSVYKSTAYDMVYGLHAMLVPWSESGSTWTQRLPGQPWGASGGNAVDMDFIGTPVATSSAAWSPGWINFDITNQMAAMSAQPSSQSHGWRLRQISGYVSALKRLHTSEFVDDPALRPKLVITYR